MMKNLRAGFTLAEVLTTLMVIGVVAAMTIPTLMNSTNDQQYKVAFKKAMSILSQGTQLMVAKEEQCPSGIKDGAGLAACFKANVLTGELTCGKETCASSDFKNVIKTGDGIAYAFYYNGGTATTESKSLEELCGTISDLDSSGSGYDPYDGKNAKCAVIVDLNGLSKGQKTLSSGTWTKGQAFSGVSGSDQAAMIITGDGVRPLYGAYDTLKRGYKYMYGDVAPSSKSST